MDLQQFLLLRLDSGNVSEIKNALMTFCEDNATSFSFPGYDKEKLDKLYALLFNILSTPTFSECQVDCLSCFKLLFRDSKYLDDVISQDKFNILVHTARLHNTQPTVCYSTLSTQDFDVMIEAEKALCNLIYNSKQVQQMCHFSQSSILQSIIYRLRTYSDPHLPYQVKLFDMKLLFLITAFCPDVRLHVKEEQHGVIYLIEILDLILKQATVTSGKQMQHLQIILDEEQVLLLAEVLKTLFNLLCKYSLSQPLDDDDPLSHRLVSFLRELLLCKGNKIDLLRTHVINLLTTVSPSSLEELGSNASDGSGSHKTDAIHNIVNYLHEEFQRRNVGNKSGLTNLENVDTILPVLLVLSEAARHHKTLRRLIRQLVLPARKDFSSRPEEGDSLLSHLTRCLSCGNTTLRDCCADLLFVLCKENPARLIKYTGYGNAAGMLAARGLLGCQNSGQYSSSSEESDTEEYIRVRDDINPITGVYEPPKSDPMIEMSEERKEYEAVQLVGMIDKLQKMGVVQACKLGEDGKPQPVEHILELRDQLPKPARKE
uniref:Synembryn-A n=2 Tax=Cacopsylla melanoneura TaxID=428564 RepID=A0A8D8LRZ6_9HEMI